MASHLVEINRAPVLTLWAAVVAERLGFNWEEALTLGKAVAGLNAQSKGRRLGIFEPAGEGAEKARRKRAPFHVDLLGRKVPAKNTDDGVRAMNKDRVVDPQSVRSYLHGKFGDDYGRAKSAMQSLARAFTPKVLAEEAYGLYEELRPDVPAGKRGWGAKGRLNLQRIRRLANRGG